MFIKNKQLNWIINYNMEKVIDVWYDFFFLIVEITPYNGKYAVRNAARWRRESNGITLDKNGLYRNILLIFFFFRRDPENYALSIRLFLDATNELVYFLFIFFRRRGATRGFHIIRRYAPGCVRECFRIWLKIDLRDLQVILRETTTMRGRDAVHFVLTNRFLYIRDTSHSRI